MPISKNLNNPFKRFNQNKLCWDCFLVIESYEGVTLPSIVGINNQTKLLKFSLKILDLKKNQYLLFIYEVVISVRLSQWTKGCKQLRKTATILPIVPKLKLRSASSFLNVHVKGYKNVNKSKVSLWGKIKGHFSKQSG